MKANHSTSVLILGAGPAGLSLGRELGLRRIPYMILEKATLVGSTFASMTESTTYGPWMNNTLPGSPVPWSRALSRTTRVEYAQYLRDYATFHGLRVQCGVRVEQVSFDERHFWVKSTAGELYKAEVLVNATGIFGKPHLPDYPGSQTCGIPQIHSSAYRSPRTVLELTGQPKAKVLVVGCGLSAGETIAELHKAGYQVHLSYRGRIETWPSQLGETLLSPLTYAWEELSLRLGFGKPGNLRPRLRRGRQYSLLTSGKVPTHPDICRMEPDGVVFADRNVESFDLVIYATGYRPALDHLSNLFPGPALPWTARLESVEIPNCFFLGLPGSRTFRSEFLRGIREDAVYLAGVIAQRLAPAPTQPPAGHSHPSHSGRSLHSRTTDEPVPMG